MRVDIVRPFSLLLNFAGSIASVVTPASLNTVTLQVLKNGSNIGSITFAPGSQTGVFSSNSAVSFISGDQFIVQVDNSVYAQNSSFADLTFTFYGTST
jgi:hypothetical protein